MDLIYYNGEHSVDIGSNNTWTTYHLIPTSKPTVSVPKPRRVTVEIPGADGVLDLSTALTGRILWERRTGSWQFLIEPGYNFFSIVSILLRDLAEFNNAGEQTVILRDYRNAAYTGRIFVDDAKCDQKNNVVVLSYDLSPYVTSSVDGQWKWDPFNFTMSKINEDGTVSNISNM